MTVVFLDVSLGPKPLGRVKIELYADQLPKTTENFRQLCTGEYRELGRPIGYKNSRFHRVVPGFMIQGGDFVRGNGTGSKTIYGVDSFEDEGFMFKNEPMTIAMANSGPNTNGCQFFINLAHNSFLDGKHVVFGRVVEGEEIIRTIERVTVDNERPVIDINISNCGEM
ncbi:hypothetical protein KL942_000278 [Ogataea angusta]|uniref:Peptidyl-prolyl cis-trans isomerase n=1 Tax=Pichia angusta TaxID=870730 RepID=A0AAN6DK27_PICAN|nr:uncharacterized protein KL928_001074 [Ogataea angusta]KAG7820990.1 hypothetical protein KL928_001074 [Ogataea angusta]KAG7831944.1 hypothetical protein KL920_000279 [Ogataea angusta]KAG7836116.1 hypothetical protein KL943_001765 [Ogataea angusta]KAG7843182.1 hypothetical protein KL942_000278 [Ogataea angusta]KAG7852665.1 hypothetical protein KL940_000366 [Ogataea angusta]